jgi:hypothetical protein
MMAMDAWLTALPPKSPGAQSAVIESTKGDAGGGRKPWDKLARALPALVIVAATMVAAGRIAAVEGAFSHNDRSRWATVRALVENQSFVIGSRVREGDRLVDRGIIAIPGWTTIDVVLDPKSGLYYSSKPPLLAYLVSFPVRACAVAGFSLVEHRAFVMRVVLVIFNLLPFVLALIAVRRILAGAHPLALLAALVTVGLGSLFATFVVTLNAHVLAGSAAVVALWAAFPVQPSEPALSPLRLAVAGLAAAAAAAFEPTALAFLLFLALALVRAAPGGAWRRAVFFGFPAALPLFLHLVTTAFVFGDALFFVHSRKAWFRFDGSYWQKPSGLDVGDHGVFSYVFHLLVGHHGLFSITPALLIGAVGTALIARDTGKRAAVLGCAAVASVVAARTAEALLEMSWQVSLACPGAVAGWLLVHGTGRSPSPGKTRASIVFASAVMSLGFYAAATSSFGGVALGPRWLLWLVPLLVLGIPRALTALPSRAGRALLVLVVLGVGVFLATPRGGLNPWQHPRLYER